jgi:hypothetical protein
MVGDSMQFLTRHGRPRDARVRRPESSSAPRPRGGPRSAGDHAEAAADPPQDRFGNSIGIRPRVVPGGPRPGRILSPTARRESLDREKSTAVATARHKSYIHRHRVFDHRVDEARAGGPQREAPDIRRPRGSPRPCSASGGPPGPRRLSGADRPRASAAPSRTSAAKYRGASPGPAGTSRVST